FHPPAPSQIYTLSLHDALPIFPTIIAMYDAKMTGRRMKRSPAAPPAHSASVYDLLRTLMNNTVNPQNKKQPYARSHTRCVLFMRDRKSTRLNSSHDQISYAVFC